MLCFVVLCFVVLCFVAVTFNDDDRETFSTSYPRCVPLPHPPTSPTLTSSTSLSSLHPPPPSHPPTSTLPSLSAHQHTEVCINPHVTTCRSRSIFYLISTSSRYLPHLDMYPVSKVLAFSDEQLVAVGLKVPPTDPISALLSSVIGKTDKGSDNSDPQVIHPSIFPFAPAHNTSLRHHLHTKTHPFQHILSTHPLNNTYNQSLISTLTHY